MDKHVKFGASSISYPKTTVADVLRWEKQRGDMKKLRSEIQRSSRTVKLMIRHAMKTNPASEVLKMIPGFRRLYKRN
ncbi:MAG: hypothetical protein P4L77_11890 [Sulfuriferula sp.]|nr:hypothetical protein [Sulfuriferula sp.]